MLNGRIKFGSGVIGWYLNDQMHREDGPAIIWPDGSQHWYLNGQLHRTDGPAIVLSNGVKCWYLNGTKYSFDNWCDRVDIDEKTRTFLRLKYR